MKTIKVYTKKRCPYCTTAKIWLKQHNYEFTEINLENKDDQLKFTTDNPSLRTVPQIFLGEKLIGGFTELIKSELA